MEPGTVSRLLTEVCDTGEVVELSGVDFSGVGNDDRWSIKAVEFRLECGEVDPTGPCIEASDGVASETELAEGLDGTGVDGVAGNDRNRRVTGETSARGIETATLAGPLTGGGETDQVAHRRATAECARPGS